MIRNKLIFIIIAFFIINLFVVGNGLYINSRMKTDGRAINISGSERMRTLLLAFLIGQYIQSIEEKDIARAKKFEQAIVQEKEIYQEYLDGLIYGSRKLGLVRAETEEIRTQYGKVVALWENYRRAIEDILAGRDVITNEQFLIENTVRLKDIVHKTVELHDELYKDKFDFLVNLTFLLVVFSVLLLFVITYIIFLKVLRPLNNVNNRMSEIARGASPAGAYIFYKAKDELGLLAERFNSFVNRIWRAEEKMQDAKKFAERANKAKSEFLSNMSHELRTPLNAIIGFSEILKDESFGPLNDKQKEYINYIWEGGRHLLFLINDILDLSKIEAGKVELKLTNFDLKATIESSLSMIKEKAMKHNITILEDIKDDVSMIKADERKVKQIMFNLLSNAVKFTPDGGKIEIEAKRTKNEVLVSVGDTGIGIEEKAKDKVFKEFEQIDSTYSRKYAGTGLGMPLTKKFVELHGGKIWFESEGKNKGSRFSFTLPMKKI